MSESCGGIAGSDAALILGEGSVADPEQPVLDLPMGASEFEQAGGGDCLGRDRRNGVDELTRAAVLQLAQALDAYDLAGARQSRSSLEGIGRTAMRRVSMRPCAFSTVSARRMSLGSTRSAR
jgi:hypothetical protein